MRVNSYSCRTLSRAIPSDPPLGKLTREHLVETESPSFIRDPHASSCKNRFQLVYVGHDHEDLCETSQVVPVPLVRSSGIPAPIGTYLVAMLPDARAIASEEHFVSDGRHNIPLVGLRCA